MRKITGKALAAVLAMALLTSSFSGTFAFAASSERAGSVSFSGDDEVTLVKDTEDPNEYKFDLEGLIGTMTLTTTDKAEKDVAVDSEDLSFRHAKGDNLISIKDGKARVKSDKTGRERRRAGFMWSHMAGNVPACAMICPYSQAYKS